jgi:hypothetical protein
VDGSPSSFVCNLVAILFVSVYGVHFAWSMLSKMCG